MTNSRHDFSRRQWLRAVGMSACGVSACGWLPALAGQVARDPQRRRQCILLWMSGGPSQTDTFDMKPGHENGGEFQEIATNVPGIRFSEHLPRLSQHADKLAIVRSLSTKEGDHARGTYLMRTGRPPGVLPYPAIGAALGKQLATEHDGLPNYISIVPSTAISPESFGPGFLGPRFAPLIVTNARPMPPAAPTANPPVDAPGEDDYADLRIESLRASDEVSTDRRGRRLALWRQLETDFVKRHPSSAARSHLTVYENALRLMDSSAAAAFDLSSEPKELRDRYGKGAFGQGCLMARRLIEQGAPFVEVTLGSDAGNPVGWDTHADNFNVVKKLSAELDAGWATLLADLAERGLLETTTILWMGEFGRTPKINGNAGRDHFPRAWTCVFAGGGIAGGQVYGRTDIGGGQVEEDPADVANVLATLCQALGVSPATKNIANTGRPIDLIEGAPLSRLSAG